MLDFTELRSIRFAYSEDKKADPVIQSSRVKLCPLYWSQSEVDRAATLIHEWMHLHYLAGDVSYEWDPAYADLNSTQQLLNADAFSQFVKELCDE